MPVPGAEAVEAAGAVDDESFTPSKRGVASVTPAAYRLQFDEPRDHYQIAINRLYHDADHPSYLLLPIIERE